MEREMINTLIDKYTQMFTVKLIKNVRKLVVLFFILSACFLLTLKSYIFTGVLFVLLIGLFTYLSVILKKNILTIYNGISIGLVLCGNIVLLFNVSMYSIQKINGFFDPILLIVILFIEVLCLIAGFFYTRRCVRKGTVRKARTAVAAPIAFVLPGMLGYFLTKYMSSEASIQIQNVFFTIVFALGSSMMMFVFGMAHIAIIYYIWKYNIADRKLSIET